MTKINKVIITDDSQAPQLIYLDTHQLPWQSTPIAYCNYQSCSKGFNISNTDTIILHKDQFLHFPSALNIRFNYVLSVTFHVTVWLKLMLNLTQVSDVHSWYEPSFWSKDETIPRISGSWNNWCWCAGAGVPWGFSCRWIPCRRSRTYTRRSLRACCSAASCCRPMKTACHRRCMWHWRDPSAKSKVTKSWSKLFRCSVTAEEAVNTNITMLSFHCPKH